MVCTESVLVLLGLKGLTNKDIELHEHENEHWKSNTPEKAS
jgi:hypothetical protein